MGPWKPVALHSSIHASPRVPLVPLSPAAAPFAPAFVAPFAPAFAASSNPGNGTTAEEQTPHVESGTAQAAAAAKARMQPTLPEESESEEEGSQCSENPSTKLSDIPKAIRACVSRLRVAVAGSDQAAADILWKELVSLVPSINDADIPNLSRSFKMNDNIQKPDVSGHTEETKTNGDLNQKLEDFQRKLDIEQERNAALEALHKTTASKAAALEERMVRITLDQQQHQNLASNLKQELARETATKWCDELAEHATNKISLEKNIHALREEVMVETVALSKEQEKSASLQEEYARIREENASLTIALDAMKSSESAARIQVDKLSQEVKTLWDRYKQLQAEHGQKLTEITEQSKKIDTLIADLQRGAAEIVNLKQQIARMLELEKSNSKLAEINSQLLAQVGTLEAALATAQGESKRAKSRLRATNDELMRVQTELTSSESSRIQLDADFEDMLGRTLESRALKAENLKLKSLADDKMALQETIQELQKNKLALEKAVREWEDLATKSYTEYKALLPLYKEADQYRKGCVEKDKAIKVLNDDLTTAKKSCVEKDKTIKALKGDVTTATKGEAERPQQLLQDAKYWQNRYDGLLDKCIKKGGLS
ncbi:hypothetical protein IQ07DRAFT_680994 [Pyrenochaeta sp. DS3sAY3a]|nr:hypothetical protein IQ07DRAFT_680994 [Pyrenochaeta sp. DS3sAY3a]